MAFNRDPLPEHPVPPICGQRRTNHRAESTKKARNPVQPSLTSRDAAPTERSRLSARIEQTEPDQLHNLTRQQHRILPQVHVYLVTQEEIR